MLALLHHNIVNIAVESDLEVRDALWPPHMKP